MMLVCCSLSKAEIDKLDRLFLMLKISQHGREQVIQQFIDSAGNKYYYVHDAQGSVVALLNNSGAVVEAYSYGPFGETTVHTGAGSDGMWLSGDDTTAATTVSGYGNPYMYTARRFDDESGLYYTLKGNKFPRGKCKVSRCVFIRE